MKNSKHPNGLVQEYLESVQGMDEATTDPFFYTRLQAKMDNRHITHRSLKPVWAITILAAMLIINGMMLLEQQHEKTTNAEQVNGLQHFAASYDLSIQSSY